MPLWSPERGRKGPSPAALQEAVAREAKNRAGDLLAGVLRYVEADYKRTVPEKPAIWRKGSARLLDYGAGVVAPEKIKSVALFIPSLINRYYILDLEENRSLLRYLATQDIYPLALDWGEPGKAEAGYDCGDYITEVLLPAIDFVHSAVGHRVALAGYCMGGVLALAAAKLRPQKISALALLATPWDFHCRSFAPFVIDKHWLPTVESLLASNKTVPADVIQALFYMADPFVFESKFRRFVSLDPQSRAAKDFIALEHWVNDGVPMTARAARDCMIGWAQENILMRGEWNVGGKTIDPKTIKLPTFFAMPKSDHVVPLDCAAPLAKAFPKAKVVYPGAGHVGMIVGHRARQELWQKLGEWLGPDNGLQKFVIKS